MHMSMNRQTISHMDIVTDINGLDLADEREHQEEHWGNLHWEE